MILPMSFVKFTKLNTGCGKWAAETAVIGHLRSRPAATSPHQAFVFREIRHLEMKAMPIGRWKIVSPMNTLIKEKPSKLRQDTAQS